MNSRIKMILLPIAVLAVGIIGMKLIGGSAKPPGEKPAKDLRPSVRVQSLESQDHQVTLFGHGELKPREAVQLAAQVSGEVISWHPNFVAGGLVKRGDTLFQIEPDTYQAQVLRAESQVSLAQAQLIEEQARAEVARREASNMDNSAITPLYLREPQLLSAKAALKSAEANLKIAQRDLANCTIKAPFDALVVSRNLGKGQFVNQGTRVAEIYNVESGEVIIPIPGFDRPFLPDPAAGQKAQIVSKGALTISRDGIIDRDLGIIDNATRMSQLVVRLDDPYGLKSAQPAIKYGSYVEVRFAGATLTQVFKVPQQLVNNNTLWLMDDNQQLRPRKIRPLREDGDYVYIRQGLNDGEQLVTTLPEYPQDGMQVKVEQADNADLVANRTEQVQ